MSIAPSTTAKSRRRWLRVSLRTLLACVVMASFPLGWLAHHVRRAQGERIAQEKIRELGGRMDRSLVSDPTMEFAPAWLEQLVGEAVRHCVIRVTIQQRAITDADLGHLRRLTNLKVLNLPGTPLTDVGLAHLPKFRRLEGMKLSATQITDAGLEHIQIQEHLQWLDLTDTAITGAGLAQLRGLTQLNTLWLNRTSITDTGLEQLRGMSPLGCVYLRGTRMTDAGLKSLWGLTNLGFLDLRDTQVTGEGINELQRVLPNLTISYD